MDKEGKVLIQNSEGNRLSIIKLDDGRYEIEMIDSEDYQSRIYLSSADLGFFVRSVQNYFWVHD